MSGSGTSSSPLHQSNSNSNSNGNVNSTQSKSKELSSDSSALTLPAANKRINSLVRSIRSLLSASTAKPDKDKLNKKIERLDQVSISHGFTSKQATQILRIALGLPSNLPSTRKKHGNDGYDDEGNDDTKVNTSTSIRLIKLILPRPGQKFNKEFALLVIGNLSSPPGVLQDAPGGEDHLRDGLKPRKKLDLKVQVSSEMERAWLGGMRSETIREEWAAAGGCPPSKQEAEVAKRGILTISINISSIPSRNHSAGHLPSTSSSTPLPTFTHQPLSSNLNSLSRSLYLHHP